MKDDKSWLCPEPTCAKHHSKPHYAFPDQVDLTKKPMEEGRVLYGREDGKGYPQCDIGKDGKMIKGTGPDIDIDGYPAGLFCPHCGWIEDNLVIVKESVKKRRRWPRRQ